MKNRIFTNILKMQSKSKNHQITLKKVLSHENRWKNTLFIANNVILRFYFAQDQNFSKIHKNDKKFFLADIE
jgi:hypothetical protein